MLSFNLYVIQICWFLTINLQKVKLLLPIHLSDNLQLTVDCHKWKHNKKWQNCSESTMKTPEKHDLRQSGLFHVNFEQILRFMFPLLNLNL